MRLLTPLLVTLVLAGCGGDQSHAGGGHQMPPPQVGIASPIARTLPVVRDMTGRIEAIETVELKPQVSGLVLRVHVADGAEVKAGDPILDIDEQPLRAALARAQAEVARSDARLSLAKLQFERGKRLVDGQVISRQQYDDQEAAVSTAVAEAAAAQAALDTAKLDLGYAKLTAPIAGRIGKVLTTQGNLVQGGGPVPATLVTTLVSVDPVYVAFDLDEYTWRSVAARLRASAAGGEPVPVRIGLAGEQGHPHLGRVVFVDNRIDDGSGSIRVRARVDNPERLLTPGAFARVQVEVAPPRPVVLVHERAVQSQLVTRYVLVVDDKGITGFRPVRLGDAVGDLRVVENGLQTGDQVVVVGLAKVFYPGMPVSPVPASMETLEMAAPPAGAAHPPGASQPAGTDKPAAAGETKPVAAKADAAKPVEGAQP
jgi:multidrug efflux system membrane fusion protein